MRMSAGRRMAKESPPSSWYRTRVSGCRWPPAAVFAMLSKAGIRKVPPGGSWRFRHREETPRQLRPGPAGENRAGQDAERGCRKIGKRGLAGGQQRLGELDRGGAHGEQHGHRAERRPQQEGGGG